MVEWLRALILSFKNFNLSLFDPLGHTLNKPKFSSCKWLVLVQHNMGDMILKGCKTQGKIKKKGFPAGLKQDGPSKLALLGGVWEK